MRHDVVRDGYATPSSAAAKVMSASRATLAASSARVWRRRFVDPPVPEERDFGDSEEGVTSFALCRTATTVSLAMGSRVAGERLAARYPWLAGWDEDKDKDNGSRVVYAGTSCFFLFPSRSAVIADGRVDVRNRGHSDPTWIVEVLQYVGSAEAGDAGDIVRGTPCRRYAFDVDLKPLESFVERPPLARHRPPRLLGEAWIDDDILIRRVTWTRVDARRPRARRRPESPHRSWQTTELWDFGTPADIDLPQSSGDASWPKRLPWPASVAQVAWTLWRLKRTYRRQALRR